MNGDTLDLASEKVLLTIPASRRDEPGHTGGYLHVRAERQPLHRRRRRHQPERDSGGYAPIDERSGRALYDAQGTAANTNDLRGKILRIHPEADGTYTVPAGNMFAPGTARTKPEIYAMGFRNPFRFSVHPTDGTIYAADYGPDAGGDNANRGPGGPGRVERDQVAGLLRLAVLRRRTTSPYNDFNFANNSPARSSTAPRR